MRAPSDGARLLDAKHVTTVGHDRFHSRCISTSAACVLCSEPEKRRGLQVVPKPIDGPTDRRPGMSACRVIVTALLSIVVSSSLAHEPVPAIADVTFGTNTVVMDLRLPPEVMSASQSAHEHEHEHVNGTDSVAAGSVERSTSACPDSGTCADADRVPRPVVELVTEVRLRDERGREFPVELLEEPRQSGAGSNASSSTRFRLRAELPSDTRALRWYWPVGLGSVVLRSSENASATFAHVVEGGTESPSIPLAGANP